MVPPPPRRTFETPRRPRPNIRRPGRGARDTQRSCQSARRSDRNVRPSDRNARGLRQNAWRSPHGARRRDSRSTPRRTTAPESPGSDAPSRGRAPELSPSTRLNFPRQRAGTPDGNACRTRKPPTGICDDQSTPHRTTAPESPGGDGRSPSRSCVRTPCDNASERSRATRQRAGRRRRVKLEDRAPEDATSARRRLGRPRARTLVEDARESPATFKTAWRNQIRSPTLIHVESNPPLSGKHQKIFTDQNYKLLS